MEKKCPNCNTTILDQTITPKLVEIFELFYGEHWDNEVQDIAMEICSTCGILPELLGYVENQLNLGKTKNHLNIVKEFDDNLHVPFLLQVAAPILIYLVDNSSISIQQAAIDELGVYGDEDSIGRFILAHQDSNVRILGLRALEKIAKHQQKRGNKLDWYEYLDYMVGDDESLVKTIKKKIKTKNFLKKSTIDTILPILDKKEEALLAKTSAK